MSRIGLVVVGVVLLGTARCPVGCRPAHDTRPNYKPSVQIPLQQIDACRYRAGEIPAVEGFVWCHIDEESALEHVHWDFDAGILTIIDKNYCSKDAGSHAVELVFYEKIQYD